MKNPFKRKEVTQYKDTFTGKVRFVHKDKIKEGKIFGKPFTEGMIFSVYQYYIVSEDKVYKVAESAIERLGK